VKSGSIDFHHTKSTVILSAHPKRCRIHCTSRSASFCAICLRNLMLFHVHSYRLTPVAQLTGDHVA